MVTSPDEGSNNGTRTAHQPRMSSLRSGHRFLIARSNASAIKATVDEVDRIVDVIQNLGGECAAEIHGNGVI
jgi:hypothetical protein